MKYIWETAGNPECIYSLNPGKKHPVPIPELENCFMDNQFIWEHEAKQIDYDNAAMVADLKKLYKKRAISRVNID